jgi:hypothetical protein
MMLRDIHQYLGASFTFAHAQTHTNMYYSHSMVAGGLDVQSSITRLMPGHSLVMRVEIVASTS